jgi:hypothetical protein
MTLIIIRMNKQNNKETENRPKQPFRATNPLWSSSNNKKKTNKDTLTNFLYSGDVSPRGICQL